MMMILVAQVHIYSCVMQVCSLLSSSCHNVQGRAVCLQNLSFILVGVSGAQWASVSEFVISYVSVG